MSVAFLPGSDVSRGDLDLYLTNASGNPTNVAEITYAIYYLDMSGGPPGTEVLIGSATRTPVNPTVGEYYASLTVPPTAQVGDYRIRWTFREQVGAPQQQVVMEFAVVQSGTQTATTFSAAEQAMIAKFRTLVRDSNPDRNYRFRPPEHEQDISNYNRVFGYIWEDDELLEYLNCALDEWNAAPPETEGLSTIDLLVAQKPTWRTYILWGAIRFAAQALAFNWIVDEFSVSGSEEVTVILPDGEEISVTLEELYEVCHG